MKRPENLTAIEVNLCLNDGIREGDQLIVPGHEYPEVVIITRPKHLPDGPDLLVKARCETCKQRFEVRIHPV